MGYGYVTKKAREVGGKWCKSICGELLGEFSDPSVAFFMQAMPCNRDTWAFVDSLGPKVRELYWREVGFVALPLDDAELALPCLLAEHRGQKAVELITLLVSRLRHCEIPQDDLGRIRTLAATVLDVPVEDVLPSEHHSLRSSAHGLDQLLTFLEAHGTEQELLARWEWKWLPLLSDGRRGLSSLQAQLTVDPGLFVEMLKCVYRPSDQDPDADERSDPDVAARARLALELLDSWKKVPGLMPSACVAGEDVGDEGLRPIRPAFVGDVDDDGLTDWATRAIQLAKEAKRLEVCHRRLGRQLAFAPADADGTWPCTPVRRLIDRVQDEELDLGMVRAVLYRRGAHYSGDNGAQERVIANQFRQWCEATCLQYPRTGAILRRLAEHYEDEAKREDECGRLEEYG